jgi:hypothetical protein
MKTIILIVIIMMGACLCQAQSIVGRWQLVKQSNCVDDELEEDEDTGIKEMVDDMKGLSGAAPQVLELKENNNGEESTKIINRKKSYNSRSFLYRYSNGSLYILDKKSRTIIDGFTVEKLEGDSLIISNVDRACDTKVFVRIK